ncbi:hypothetical protein B0J11DRAFT_186367 [Dendryphion nanum]|uniref:Uncharacterized protein n=1 Tax=Dendryphion nanum TaxID=256645 RepID=A0A9P9IAH4_9PLEO|nr:hypothetical protein B0J11DRAFT_186367 [Dendryphion nanum]
MRITDILACYLLGAASGFALVPRDPPEHEEEVEVDSYGGHDEDDSLQGWKPKTKAPHFFNLMIVDDCHHYDSDLDDGHGGGGHGGGGGGGHGGGDGGGHNGGGGGGGSGGGGQGGNSVGGTTTTPEDCFAGYAVRLDKGVAIATPYKKWYDPPLPTFFVDDDTQMYTVSKQPLQLYIDSIGGGLRYTKVGWLPPNAISISFYHTGTNPLDRIKGGYSPSLLTWPSTQGITPDWGKWLLCPNGKTGQYTIFVNDENFDPQDVTKAQCFKRKLGAVNADPWKKKKHGGKKYGHDDSD